MLRPTAAHCLPLAPATPVLPRLLTTTFRVPRRAPSLNPAPRAQRRRLVSQRKRLATVIRIVLQAVIPPPLLLVSALSVREDPSRARAQARAQALAQAPVRPVHLVLAPVANRRVRVYGPNPHPPILPFPPLPPARRLGHIRFHRLLTIPVPLHRMANAGRSIDIRTSTGRAYV